MDGRYLFTGLTCIDHQTSEYGTLQQHQHKSNKTKHPSLRPNNPKAEYVKIREKRVQSMETDCATVNKFQRFTKNGKHFDSNHVREAVHCAVMGVHVRDVTEIGPRVHCLGSCSSFGSE